MSVHKAITKHVNHVNERVKLFQELDTKRELYIAEALDHCLANQPFSVDKINEVTNKINELAKLGTIPSRKTVTPAMVQEYASTLSN